MPKPSDIEKNYIYNQLLSLEERIREFALPLKSQGIHFFTYSRIYKDNKFIFLCNNNEWYELKWQNNLFDFNGFVCVDELKLNNFTKYVVTGSPQGSIKLLPHMHRLGLWNSIDYYWVFDKYIEVTHFGGALHTPEIINFYINNSPYLEHLIDLFRHKFEDLIKAPDKTLLVSLNDTIPFFEEKQASPSLSLENELKTFSLISHDQMHSLSRRQAQCLGYSLHGKSAKEIARELNISHRTVEEYISNLRHKTGHLTLSSLISSLSPTQISHLLELIKPDNNILKFQS